MKFLTTIFVILIATTNISNANEIPHLSQEILEMDSTLFNAFNSGNIAEIKNIMDLDLEFYHDTGGLTDYKQTVEGLEKLLSIENRPTRTLIEDKTEIYQIKDFGALQVGVHKFCHLENGKDDCGTFKFFHLWSNVTGKWKLKRIVSYGH